MHKLLSKRLTEKPSDDTLTKALKSIIFTDLNGCYVTTEVENLLSKACLLDPHFKALSFLHQTEKNDIISNVEEETLEMIVVSPSETRPALVDPQTKKIQTGEKRYNVHA